MGIKTSKQQQKSEQSKKKIFDCAISLFRKYGYHRVSVEDIVRESDASIGSFYHYFKSKEELLILFLTTYTHSYYEDYEEQKLTGAEIEPSALKRLHSFVLFSLYLTQSGGDEFIRIAMAYLLRAPSFESAFKYMFDPERPFARISRDLIREGQEKGEIRTDKTDEELFSMMSLFSNGIDERWFMSRGAFPVSGCSDMLWEFMEKMMGTGKIAEK